MELTQLGGVLLLNYSQKRRRRRLDTQICVLMLKIGSKHCDWANAKNIARDDVTRARMAYDKYDKFKASLITLAKLRGTLPHRLGGLC